MFFLHSKEKKFTLVFKNIVDDPKQIVYNIFKEGTKGGYFVGCLQASDLRASTQLSYGGIHNAKAFYQFKTDPGIASYSSYVDLIGGLWKYR